MTIERLRVSVAGVVQGVGFRPFVYRLARELNLKGWVGNSCEGVTLEVEGAKASVEEFAARLRAESPPPSCIQSCQSFYLEPAGLSDFEIRHSDSSSQKTTLVPADLAVCPQCLHEIFDPVNRRYLYPFTNCTHCGPRYSIIESIPYDRVNTSMKHFTMCPQCRREYDDPLNRRFHAQPNACPACGPCLELWDSDGNVLNKGHEALCAAAETIAQGKIAAVKGIGGFHLFVDAANEEGVRLLRARKRREEKPFALMAPSPEMIAEFCHLGAEEQRLLTSSAAPIILFLKRRDGARRIASAVAPENSYLGVMLPYSPLHHILMRQIRKPVVATSGNLSDEPICTDEVEAVRRLRGIADVFLVHNRPIVRSVDDSVVRMMAGRVLMIRRARGYAPLPVSLEEGGDTVLALGGHLKNTVALHVRGQVFISQHIGDLANAEANEAFEKTTQSLKSLYEPAVARVACDLHPEYLSTKAAQQYPLPLVRVQHHHAHIVACMAENHLKCPVLGIAWDGTGWGTDHTIWGGEFLAADLKGFKRRAHLRVFRLPGGEKAVQEPRRAALGVLAEIFGERMRDYADLPTIKAFQSRELEILRQMISQDVNAPKTSSAGRLFDAVASLIGVKQITRYEGQAAVLLEHILQDIRCADVYNYAVNNGPDGVLVVDWGPMIEAVAGDMREEIIPGIISAKFHNTLVEMAVDIARRVREKRVVLSGGCFQNKYLTERMITRLRQEGFEPFWHQWVPPNDGGISLGQAVVGMNPRFE